AKALLEKFAELCGDFVGSESPHALLASTCRAVGETNEEKRVLVKLAQWDDEAPDAYLRLMELGAEDRDWPSVALNAHRYLAVNPLIAPPYRYLAQATEHLADSAKQQPGTNSSVPSATSVESGSTNSAHLTSSSLTHGPAGETSDAITAYKALLELDPPDPA